MSKYIFKTFSWNFHQSGMIQGTIDCNVLVFWIIICSREQLIFAWPWLDSAERKHFGWKFMEENTTLRYLYMACSAADPCVYDKLSLRPSPIWSKDTRWFIYYILTCFFLIFFYNVIQCINQWWYLRSSQHFRDLYLESDKTSFHQNTWRQKAVRYGSRAV